MRNKMIVAALLLAACPALAQTPPPAPPAGSGGGGPVGPSVQSPTTPTGKTPPGTPAANSVPAQISRDSAGQAIIGQTVTPPGTVPGDPGAKETGARR